MNNQILADGTVLYYALKLDGKIISQPVSERFIAEQHRATLAPDKQPLAEVVTVTPDGRELLLG